MMAAVGILNKKISKKEKRKRFKLNKEKNKIKITTTAKKLAYVPSAEYADFINSLPIRFMTNAGDQKAKLFSKLKPNDEVLDIYSQLLRLLLSSNLKTQRRAFVASTLLLRVNKKVKIEALLEKIDALFVSDKDNTKGERNKMKCARILALGSIVRSRDPVFLTPFSAQFLSQFCSFSSKRLSFFFLSTPFILHLLSIYPPSQFEEMGEELQKLLSIDEPKKNSLVLTIALTAWNYGHTTLAASCSTLSSVESLTSAVVGFVRSEDKVCLAALFKYLNSNNLGEEFWRSLVPKIGPYHFHLLCSLIEEGAKQKTNLAHLINVPLFNSVLGIFQGDDIEAQTRAEKILSLLLNSLLTLPVDLRSNLLPQLFDLSNSDILTHYKHTYALLRSFIEALTSDELSAVCNSILPFCGVEGWRGSTAVSFLSKLGGVAKLGGEEREKVGEVLFKSGFCNRESGDVEVDEGIMKLHERKSVDGFCSLIIKSGNHLPFLNHIFKFIRKISGGNGELTLKLKLEDEDAKLLKKASLALKKSDDEELNGFICSYGIYMVVDKDISRNGLQALLPLVQNPDEKSRSDELFKFLLAELESGVLICDYERLFSHLVKKGLISLNGLQNLLDVISDHVDENNEQNSDSQNSDDDENLDFGSDSSGDSDDEENGEKLAKMSKKSKNKSELNGKIHENEANGETAKNLKKMKKESSEDNNEAKSGAKVKNSTSDDEKLAKKLKKSSPNAKKDEKIENSDENEDDEIDLDLVDEAELTQMDSALSSLFALRKKMTQKSQNGAKKVQETQILVRSLHLLLLLLKRIKNTENNGQILLLTILPVVELLKHRDEVRNVAVGILKKLSKMRKLDQNGVEKGMVEEVKVTLRGHLRSKFEGKVKKVIGGVINMLDICFPAEKSKKRKKSKSVSTNTTTTPPDRKNKKNKKEIDDSTTTSKPPKKKKKTA